MERKQKTGITVIISVLAAAVIALGAYVITDRIAENKAELARAQLYENGLEGSSAALNDDIASGKMILAYHHAREAADYADRLGDDESARRFNEISSQILAGGQGDGDTNAVPTDEDADAENVETAVSEIVPEEAERCAARFFGGDILTAGRRRENGDILFSRSNAYALIDGDTCVPIEAAISLDTADPLLSDGECVSSALKFIRDFFPEEVSASSQVTNVRLEDERRVGITVDAAGVEMKLTVRRDNGRVVRFVSSVR